jgi:hypothetical protein
MSRMLIGVFLLGAIAADEAQAGQTYKLIGSYGTSPDCWEQLILSQPTPTSTWVANWRYDGSGSAYEKGYFTATNVYNGAVEGGTPVHSPLAGVAMGGVWLYGVHVDVIWRYLCAQVVVDDPVSSPFVLLTQPVDGTVYAVSNNITFQATASDSDDVITKVEFYQGSTKLGEDQDAPYTYTWNSVAAGTYALTAVAYNTNSLSTTSTPVSVTVQASGIPTVLITSPGDLSAFNPGQNITINVNASDSGGSVTKVEFYQGDTKIGEDTSAAYSCIWSNVPAGYYTLTARATDNSSNIGVSPPARIYLSVPSSFNLLSPPNQLSPVVEAITPIFSWEAASGALSYNLLLVPHGQPMSGNYAVINTTITAPLTSYQPGVWTLKQGQSYDWRVTATDPSGSTNCNQSFSFTMKNVPSDFNLLSPPNQTATAINTLTPTLTWQTATGATAYALLVCRDITGDRAICPPYSVLQATIQAPTTNCAVAAGVLEYNTTYAWKVIAVNSVGAHSCNYTTYYMASFKTPLTPVTITATDASKSGPVNGSFTVTRGGPTNSLLDVYLQRDSSSTATQNVDYTLSGGTTVTIPAGQYSATLTVIPITNTPPAPNGKAIIMSILPIGNYQIASPSNATCTINDNAVTQKTPHGVPYTWLALYGITNNQAQAETNDPDGDGLATWKEYYAGTDPTSKSSALKVLALTTNRLITWYGTTNSGVTNGFKMYRSTNLLSGTWQLIASNLTRAANGTNSWTDASPPAFPFFFYRPATPAATQ